MVCPPVSSLPAQVLRGIEGLLDDVRDLIQTYQQHLRDHDRQLAVSTKHAVGDDGRRSASPVTPLDLAVQRVLVGGLTWLLGPDLGIFAEEDGLDDPAALAQAWCAVIDPIDMTRGLIGGRLLFTVNLALIVDGSVYGWMGVPAVGWRIHTSPEGIISNGQPIPRVPLHPDKLRVAVTAEDYLANVSKLPARIGGRMVLPVVCSGISFRLALLAIGMVDAVVIWPQADREGMGLWDHLPLSANLAVVGIGVQGLLRDADLASLRPPRWAAGLVAGTPEVRLPLRDALLAAHDGHQPGRTPQLAAAAGSVWVAVGRIIGEQRRALGLPKNEAARRAGVSNTTWRRLETGANHNPTDETLARVARAVEVAPEVVFRSAGRPAPEPMAGEAAVSTRETPSTTAAPGATVEAGGR